MKKRLAAALATIALCLGLVPTGALAADDILLGVFFTSEEDVTDTIYASYDGQTFRAVGTPYRDNTPNSTADLAYLANHRTHKCPGLCYYGGYYWMISNWNRYDGRFWPMLSYSRDLKTWTHPEGINLGSGYNGITLAQQPDATNAEGRFDIVAPKMRVASDGSLYITFCAGYFSGFNGQEFGHDQMQVYTCRVAELSASDGTSAGDGYLWPHITLRTEPAQKVTAPDVANGAGANIIDSNLYTEGGTTYLLLKRDGFNEEIYRSGTPSNPASWTRVNGRAAYGYEGMCIARANGTYYLFGDGVEPVQPLGVRAVTSASITRGDEWQDGQSTGSSKLHDLTFLGQSGQRMSARHGDVITLAAGSGPWNQVRSLLGTVTMYRLYNPNSGEHFYTADTGERSHLISVGWHDEGVGWTAPGSSGAPVYRLYSGTDHHYTMNAEERDHLVSVGWKYEGIGWYSDEGHGVPLYRQFNPNVNPSARTNNSGSHNYTTSREENDFLVSRGWKAEGIGWYGVG